jgi:polyhydroxyalkanoate synthesis regulator phasin
MEQRIAELESITEQLNDTSTQPDTPQVAQLQKQIADVEKQLHAALGAKHKAGINGSTEPYRIPSMHSLHNYVEGVRRRVKNLEDLEGASHCVTTVKQLQVNCTADVPGQTQPSTTIVLTKNTSAPKAALATIPEEEIETEEDILTR